MFISSEFRNIKRGGGNDDNNHLMTLPLVTMLSKTELFSKESGKGKERIGEKCEC